jgi:hypothetical protein
LYVTGSRDSSRVRKLLGMSGRTQDNFEKEPSPTPAGGWVPPRELDGSVDPIDPIVGIDLGTTNSLVAFADARGPRILGIGGILSDDDPSFATQATPSKRLALPRRQI